MTKIGKSWTYGDEFRNLEGMIMIGTFLIGGTLMSFWTWLSEWQSHFIISTEKLKTDLKFSLPQENFYDTPLILNLMTSPPPQISL